MLKGINFSGEIFGEKAEKPVDFDPTNEDFVKMIADALGDAVKKQAEEAVRRAAEKSAGLEEGKDRFRFAVLEIIGNSFPTRSVDLSGRVDGEELPTAIEVLEKIISKYKENK